MQIFESRRKTAVSRKLSKQVQPVSEKKNDEGKNIDGCLPDQRQVQIIGGDFNNGGSMWGQLIDDEEE